MLITDFQYMEIFKSSEKRTEKLSKIEIEHIAKKINEKINIPFVDEEKEYIIILKLINQMDEMMYKFLPNEIYQMIHFIDDGVIDESELKFLKTRLVDLLNSLINIPFISEEKEGELIEIFLDFILSALKKGQSILNKALKKEEKIVDKFLEDIDIKTLTKHQLKKLIHKELLKELEKLNS